MPFSFEDTVIPHKYIPDAVMNLLLAMYDGEKNDEVYGGELVVEGKEAMVGLIRFHIRTVNIALTLCLLHCEGSETDGRDFRRYTLNEEGRNAITTPNYRPLIIDHLKSH